MANDERPILKDISNEGKARHGVQEKGEATVENLSNGDLQKHVEEKKQMMRRYEEMKKEIIGAENHEMKVRFVLYNGSRIDMLILYLNRLDNF